MPKTGIKNYTLLGIMYIFWGGKIMSYEQKKRYLCTYEKYILTIKNYQSEIDYINSLYGLTGNSLSDMPKTHNQTDLTNRVIKIDYETEKFLKNLEIKRAVAAKKAREIIDVINTAPDETDKLILFQRHIELRKMTEIQRNLGYSRSGLDKRYRQAVNSIVIKKL